MCVGSCDPSAHLISCGHLHFASLFFLLYCCVCVVRGSVGPVISDYAEKAATEHRR